MFDLFQSTTLSSLDLVHLLTSGCSFWCVFQSRPFFRDRRKFVHMADPLLQGRYPLRCFHHAVAITAMCLQEQPTFRPLMGDVVVALEYLASQPYTSETGSGKHSPRSLCTSEQVIGSF